MSGFLKHYLDQRMKYDFKYVGVDRWPEAIEVAKELLPHTEFHVRDILEDHIEGSFDYVCLTNIAFGKNAGAIVDKLIPLAETAMFIAMPDGCGDYLTTAEKYGDCEVFDCGESTLIRVNVNGTNKLLGTTDLGKELDKEG